MIKANVKVAFLSKLKFPVKEIPTTIFQNFSRQQPAQIPKIYELQSDPPESMERLSRMEVEENPQESDELLGESMREAEPADTAVVSGTSTFKTPMSLKTEVINVIIMLLITLKRCLWQLY